MNEEDVNNETVPIISDTHGVDAANDQWNDEFGTKKSKASKSSSKKKKHKIRPPAEIEVNFEMKKLVRDDNIMTEDADSEEGDKIGALPTILGREPSLGSVSFLTKSNTGAAASNFSANHDGSLENSNLSNSSSVPPSEQSKAPKYDRLDNHEGNINFLLDDPQEMLRGRRIALSLLHNKWYNPNAGKRVRTDKASVFDSVNSAEDMVASQKQLPSLEKAWAYFEHVTLTRYIHSEHNKNPNDMTMWERYKYAYTHSDELFERAQPGEKRLPTRLYDWISTPHVQLGDFGLGFGLYFSTLRAIRNILLIAGFMSAFNIYFYSTGAYDNSDTDIDYLLKGSAVCTQTEWVPCPDCYCYDNTTIGIEQGWHRTTRCYNHEFADGSSMAFVVKNQCLSDDHEKLYILGLVNFATLIFLVISVYFLLDYHLDKETVAFDEDEQTAQDYSILIKNPPPTATNPVEWRQYFEETFPGVKVVAVTCNVNNDNLIKALIKRRVVLRKMEFQLDHGTDMGIDNLALLAAQEQEKRGKYLGPIIGLILGGLPELLSKLVALNTSIKGLTQLSYPCTNVYVTFELESHQRLVLSKLAVGLRYIRNNDTSKLEDPSYAFRDTVLLAQEAPEPNSVRWQDLNADKSNKSKEHLFTFLLSFLAIYICFILVQFASGILPAFGVSFTIAGMNLSYPEVAKQITNLESHSNESKVQTSLFIKIACFRWVNTAIIITVITPFTNTLTPTRGLITQIAAIFFAEIVTTNVIQLADVWGHTQRHFLAPRMKTQDAMNRWFRGYTVELAERYTNMTKIMFLAFWYCSIFPGGLFFAAVALTVNYYTDRFSLMRTWQRAPMVGNEVATFSRQYFLSSACIVLAAMSSFYWAAFPFDNLCKIDETYAGVEELIRINTTEYPHPNSNFTVYNEMQQYRFCNQDFILSGQRFPFIYREGVRDHGEWMTEEQRNLSRIFAGTSIGVIVLVGLKYLHGLGQKVRKQFHREHEVDTEDQEISFYDVRNIAAYVPQVRSDVFSYPLILCSTRRLSDEVLDWTDPDQDYAYYDLTKDADHVLQGGTPGRNSFDRVRYWPPNNSIVKTWKPQVQKGEARAKRRRGKNIFNSVSRHASSASLLTALDASQETGVGECYCPNCQQTKFLPPNLLRNRRDHGSDDGASDDNSLIEPLKE